MKNFVQPGWVLTIPAPAAVASGGVVIVGSLIGIAETDAGIGEDVAVQTRGVFALPKAAALAVSVGDAIYWNSGSGVANKTASGNTLIGYATAAALAADATVNVRIG